MDAVREVPVRDAAAVRVWRVVREPFTAATWRRFAYAVIAFPTSVVCVPLALVGAPAGRWQRRLVRRWLGAGEVGGVDGPADGPRAGLVHALVSLPVNLLTLAVTLYGWAIVPMNLGWPLRAGSDHSHAWGGPTFAGAWAFHAVLGGLGFLLLMPWVGRGLAAVQLRVARAFLAGAGRP
ncbi:hypothetical protein ACQEWB_15975 [Streptomyces sp. CA-249302]|uniref:hypothetical protein n=1 Tax=Streptomyces sp. CA-249302 TaxID=3240058 RepID=UPI003D8EEFC9